MPEIERRYATGIELREAEGEPARLIGHAAVFNSPAVIAGMFREQIASGAFARAIKEKQDVRALINHDPSKIIGRTSAGTLSLSEDRKGLQFSIDLPATADGRDIRESVKRGDVTGMSFSFANQTERWETGKDGELDLRTLLDMDIVDVSPVTFPAYPDTDVATRSHEAWKAAQVDLTPNHQLRLAIARARLT